MTKKTSVTPQEIEELKSQLAELKKNFDSVCNEKSEVEELCKRQKMQIGGLQTANNKYRTQVKQLKERVEHYKALDLEGDEVNESHIRNEELYKAACEDYKRENEYLHKLVDDLNGKCDEYETRATVAEANLEYFTSLPWYKRIFTKKNQ